MLATILHYMPFRDAIEAWMHENLGNRCTKLFLKNHYSDDVCLRQLASKGLSAGILAGGMIVKIPQILKILASSSAVGISVFSLLIESLAYLITFAYNVRRQHPFMTFGETLFILIQNVLLIGLIFFLRVAGEDRPAITPSLDPKAAKAPKEPVNPAKAPRRVFLGFLAFFFWSLSFAAGAYGLTQYLDDELLGHAQSFTIALSISSRLPQIISNATNQSTGQLSALSLLMIFGGSLARVFTTYQEVADMKLLAAASVAALLNGILAFQLFFYWKNTNRLLAASPKKHKTQ